MPAPSLNQAHLASLPHLPFLGRVKGAPPGPLRHSIRRTLRRSLTYPFLAVLKVPAPAPPQPSPAARAAAAYPSQKSTKKRQMEAAAEVRPPGYSSTRHPGTPTPSPPPSCAHRYVCLDDVSQRSIQARQLTPPSAFWCVALPRAGRRPQRRRGAARRW